MTLLAKKLDQKLHRWDSDTVHEVEQLVEEIIEMADADGLDVLRSRRVEQEVLDQLDENPTR